MKVDENHPVILAMCNAAHGDGIKHKLKVRKQMLRAFEAAQRYYDPARFELREAVAKLGDRILLAAAEGKLQ